MPSQTPSPIGAACTAWTDLLATAAAHRWPAIVAVIACSTISIANAAVDPNDDVTPLAILIAFGLAVLEAFLITPILLACHRFVILGEIANDYAKSWLTRRFWRFFLLSAAFVASVFLPILLTRWRPVSDAAATVALVVAVLGFAVVSVWLSLLFPAIAIDAPGTSVRNAAADLNGNVWRIFWAGTLAVLPLLILMTIVGFIEIALDASADVLVRMAFAPLEGAFVAAVYVLLVLVASRFYLELGSRLKQPG